MPVGGGGGWRRAAGGGAGRRGGKRAHPDALFLAPHVSYARFTGIRSATARNVLQSEQSFPSPFRPSRTNKHFRLLTTILYPIPRTVATLMYQWISTFRFDSPHLCRRSGLSRCSVYPSKLSTLYEPGESTSASGTVSSGSVTQESGRAKTLIIEGELCC